MDIGPGDWVECVDATPHPMARNAGFLVSGALYCITRIYGSALNTDGSVSTGRFFGMRGSPNNACYEARRFRPIRDGQERISKPEKVTA